MAEIKTRAPHRPRRIIGALAATSMLVLSACTAGPSAPNATGPDVETPPLSSQAPAGFEEYYGQSIQWQTCDPQAITPNLLSPPKDIENYQCATVEAPMNWEDPESPSIELGVARYLGDRKKGEEVRPPLFYNLGGPGGGAVDSLSAVTQNILTAQVRDAFTVVALDPRGVGTSTPIWCMDDEERDADYALDVDFSDMSAEEVVAWNDEQLGKLGGKCLDRNGELLAYVDSDSAARDFDLVRALLGAETMDYIGYSYGTLLGAIYADVFPERVGRFVLDGVLDPSMDVNQVAAAQTAGMEASLYNWIESCVSTDKCPLGDTLEDGKTTMVEFFDRVSANPLSTSDPERPLTLGLARTAVVGSLYSTASYPILTQAMAAALNGDGSAMLFLADYFNDRGVDGVYTANTADAFLAVNALDYEPVGTVEQWQEWADEISSKHPVLGGDFGFASAGLSAWPVESRSTRRAIIAEDAPEILLIGTTHDPATPYEMALNVHDTMAHTTLLTVEGWNHTAYSAEAGPCVTGAVDRFLLNGELPKEGTTCS